MKIGELLLLKERIDPWALSHALKEQLHTRQRIVSMLISRALLDPDEGAMLLSDQLGYPAALQRHLERRDQSVLELLPPQLGSRWVVLPLAYARTGAVVVVARDPTPILGAALEHAMRASVVLSVTPSLQLERMVRAAYGGAGTEEEPMPQHAPSMSDIGQIRLEDDTPLPKSRGRSVSHMFAVPELPERAPLQVSALDTTLADIDRAITFSAVERLVMAYAQRRWRAALLMKVHGVRALGMRGHGPQISDPEKVTLPLSGPSMLSIARDTKHPTKHTPASDIQDELHSLLGLPRAPVAAPVLAADEVEAVLVVGDVIDGNANDSLAEVDRLADALGAAFVRFSR